MNPSPPRPPAGSPWTRAGCGGAIVDGNGVLLNLGAKHRLANRVQKIAVRIRSPRCVFPHCGRRAESCQVDHTRDWKHGGPTDLKNLWPLCTLHHQVKDLPGWTLTANGDGSLTWRTPFGRTHVVRPQDHRPDPGPHDCRPEDLRLVNAREYQQFMDDLGASWDPGTRDWNDNPAGTTRPTRGDAA